MLPGTNETRPELTVYDLRRKDVSKTWGFPLATFTENKRRKKLKELPSCSVPRLP